MLQVLKIFFLNQHCKIRIDSPTVIFNSVVISLLWRTLGLIFLLIIRIIGQGAYFYIHVRIQNNHQRKLRFLSKNTNLWFFDFIIMSPTDNQFSLKL